MDISTQAGVLTASLNIEKGYSQINSTLPLNPNSTYRITAKVSSNIYEAPNKLPFFMGIGNIDAQDDVNFSKTNY